MITLRDKINVDFDTREIHLTNEYGMKFVYSESQQDLAVLEEEMLKIGSYFINNYEYILAQNDVLEAENADRPSSLIDRPEIVLDLYK